MSESSVPRGEQLADEAELGEQIVEARRRADEAALVRMLAVVRVDDRVDDLLEQLDLVEVVPDVAQDEEVAVVDARAAVEHRATRRTA